MKKQAYPGEYSKPGLIFKITTREILALGLNKKPNSHSNLILKDRNRKKIAIKGIETKHEKKKRTRMKLQEINKIYKPSQTKIIKSKEWRLYLRDKKLKEDKIGICFPI